MKHYFIINPKAGKNERAIKLIPTIETICTQNSLNYEIYLTKNMGDAFKFVTNICCNSTEQIRFYACGGDGKVNEVASACVYQDNVSIGVIPLGSGNDFIKNFDNTESFKNIEAQILGTTRKIDAIKVNDYYSFNMCNVGFDAEVVHNAIQFKKKPGISGAMAYLMSVFYTLSKKLGKEVTISIDDGEEFQENVLLCAIGNGSWCGGMFNALPIAKIDDEIMDVCLVKKLSRPRFLSILSSYQKGTHFKNESTKDVIFHYPCKKITIKSENDIAIALDGEVVLVNTIQASIAPNAINFIIPNQEINHLKT